MTSPETTCINISVQKPFLRLSRATLNTSHRERKADVYDGYLPRLAENPTRLHKHRLCRGGCSPGLRLWAAPPACQLLYVPACLHHFPFTHCLSLWVNKFHQSQHPTKQQQLQACTCTAWLQCQPSTRRAGICLLEQWVHLKSQCQGTAKIPHPRGQGCTGCRQTQAEWRGGGMETPTPPGSLVLLILANCMSWHGAMGDVRRWLGMEQLRVELSLPLVSFHQDWA